MSVEAEVPVTETAEPAEKSETPVEDGKQETADGEPKQPEAQDKYDLPKGVKRKFSRLTERLRAAESQLAEHKAKSAPAATEDKKPELADFDFDTDKHETAVAKWAARQAIREEQDKAAQADRKAAEEKKQQKAAALFEELNDIEDFQDLLEANKAMGAPQFAPAIEAVLEADDGIAKTVMEHLLRNPDKVEKMSKLSPIRQIVEIGKLEAQLTAKPLPKPSAAPDPVKPIQGKATPQKDPDSMSVDEWMAWRNKQLYG